MKYKKSIWTNKKVNRIFKNSQKVVTTPFNSVGYLLTKLSDAKLTFIKNELDRIKFSFENSNSIKENINIREFFLSYESTTYLEKLIFPYILHYEESFNYIKNLSIDLTKLKLERPWVNFQRKHEYNPIHNHKGVLSFVIWIQIPYQINHEIDYFSKIDYDYKKVNGMFTFYHTDSLGKIIPQNLPVDRSFENKLLMFPSVMSHSVQPFYSSDEYRISISGNFVVGA